MNRRWNLIYWFEMKVVNVSVCMYDCPNESIEYSPTLLIRIVCISLCTCIHVSMYLYVTIYIIGL